MQLAKSLAGPWLSATAFRLIEHCRLPIADVWHITDLPPPTDLVSTSQRLTI
jgi:hypothetical protein